MKNLKRLIFNLLLIVGLSFFLESCGNSSESVFVASSSEAFSRFITTHDFYQQGINEDSYTYSFDGNVFNLSLENKRSGSVSNFDGTYEIKSSKYVDTGEDFFYVKFIFNDKSYSVQDHFLVLEGGKLIEPIHEYGTKWPEDEYGLNIRKTKITSQLSYFEYSPMSK